MLSRAVASWGRLFGLGRGGAVEEERRVWARFPCSVQAVVARSGGDARVEALLQNVSRGGANLLVSRSFALGELLSLDLPANGGGSSSVLACVLRCAAVGEGRWSLGCSFSSELSEEDLEDLAGGGTHSRQEQRARERFPCQAQASFQLVGQAGEAQPASVRDVSSNGLALEVPAPLGVGELLSLDLCRPDGSLVVTTLASVVRVTVEPGGRRVVGCNFIGELTEEHLAELV